MEPELKPICLYCQSMVCRTQPSSSKRIHHPTLGDLRTSSLVCLVCRFILNDFLFVEIRETLEILNEAAYDSLSLEIDSKPIGESLEPVQGLIFDLLNVTVNHESPSGTCLSRLLSIASCSADCKL
jgi:hypothetical protein